MNILGIAASARVTVLVASLAIAAEAAANPLVGIVVLGFVARN